MTAVLVLQVLQFMEGFKNALFSVFFVPFLLASLTYTTRRALITRNRNKNNSFPRLETTATSSINIFNCIYI